MPTDRKDELSLAAIKPLSQAQREQAMMNVYIMIHNNELGTIDGWDGNLFHGYLDMLGLRERTLRNSKRPKRVSPAQKIYRQTLAELGH